MKTLKSTFALILIFFSFFSFGQTKYSSLSDACTRRSTEVSKTIYIPSFNVGEYAFINNSSRSYRRLAKGYYYHPSTNSAFRVNLRGSITDIQSCVVSTGTLQIQETFSKGITGDSNYQVDNEGNLWYYNAAGNFHPENSWSQMSVNYNPSNGHIDVVLDLRGWGDGDTPGSYRRFKVEVSPTWYTESEIEAIDFRNQKGRDISIVGANFRANGEIMDSKQTIVHIAGDALSDVPTFFKRPSNKRIGSPSYFPNFNTVSGKINMISYGSLDDSFNYENQQYLTKGYNIVARKGNTAIPANKTIITEYDNWATDNGCPSSGGGTNNQAAAILWLQNTPMNQLYTYYQNVISMGATAACVFSDFEAFGYGVINNQVASNKLATLFRAFKQANPNCLLTSYINAKPINVQFGANISNSAKNAENAKYNLTYSQLTEGFYGKAIQYLDLNTGNPTGETGYIGDNMGIGIAGDYLHDYNESNFYAFIQEMELFKIVAPTEKVVSLYWSYLETLPGQDHTLINTVARYYKKSNNFFYRTDYKMASPFSDIYNRAMWSNFIAEGQLLWSDPHNSVNGYDYHGGNAKDVMTDAYIGTSIPNQVVNSINIGQMEISTTIGYDYNQLALYELSQNNDVITQATQSCEFSINGGSSYYSGEDLKPASAEYLKIPIVRYKKLGNIYLVLAMNKHLPHFQNQTIKVKLDGHTIDLELKGQFSTLKRIVLI